MVGVNSEFLKLLEDGDFRTLLRVSKRLAPHLERMDTPELAEITMHYARTMISEVPFRHRAWSHRWLHERDLPSGLPDDLKPKAERVYPRVAEGVGIAIATTSKEGNEAALIIRRKMEDAVANCYYDGQTNPVFVKKRMLEARDAAYSALYGRTIPNG